MWEKFKTSKERLEQCGWKFVKRTAMASHYSKRLYEFYVDIAVSPETYELYYIRANCTVLSYPELIQLTEKIKELEVK